MVRMLLAALLCFSALVAGLAHAQEAPAPADETPIVTESANDAAIEARLSAVLLPPWRPSPAGKPSTEAVKPLPVPNLPPPPPESGRRPWEDDGIGQ